MVTNFFCLTICRTALSRLKVPSGLVKLERLFNLMGMPGLTRMGSLKTGVVEATRVSARARRVALQNMAGAVRKSRREVETEVSGLEEQVGA